MFKWRASVETAMYVQVAGFCRNSNGHLYNVKEGKVLPNGRLSASQETMCSVELLFIHNFASLSISISLLRAGNTEFC
jgi:hypothetical protein